MIRHLRNLLGPNARAIRKDYRDYAKRYGSILDSSPVPASDAPRCLIIGLHNFIPSIKFDGFLGKALQFKGIIPAVLLRRDQSIARKYYRLFGITEFYYFEDFEKDPLTGGDVLLQDLLKGSPSVEKLLDFEYRGVLVGRHALSLLVRRQHAGGLQLSDPTLWKECVKILQQGVRAVHTAEKCLDQIRPAMTLFNERGYVPFGEFFDVALKRGINTIQFVGSHLDEAIHFKRYTYDMRLQHPVSFHHGTWERVQDLAIGEEALDQFVRQHYDDYVTGRWFSRQRIQSGKRILGPLETRTYLGLDPKKKTAVIFSHILWDATFFYGKGLFKDYAEWLIETVRAACANTEVNWVIKLHPANVWRLELDQYKGELAEHVLLRNHIGPLPSHVKILEPDAPLNTFSLFQVTDYCLTVRGTIGMEMPIFGVPVITAGTGRYSEYGFTINSASKQEYLERLAHIQDIPPLSPAQVALARRHAYAIFRLRPLRFETFKTVYHQDKQLRACLNPTVSLTVKNVEELAEAKDLRAFADWAVDRSRMDYLEKSE